MKMGCLQPKKLKTPFVYAMWSWAKVLYYQGSDVIMFLSLLGDVWGLV